MTIATEDLQKVSPKSNTQDKTALKILIVEDDPYFRDIIGVKLAKDGYNCESATNGQEGFELAKTYCPDLIISDIKMPVKSGSEMVNDLIQNNIKIPTIFTTGFTEYSVLAEVIQLHPIGFLEKPFKLEELNRLVNHCEEIIFSKKNKEDIYKKLKEDFNLQAQELQFKNERILVEKKLLSDIFINANFGIIAVDSNKMIHLINTYAGKIIEKNEKDVVLSPGICINQFENSKLLDELMKIFKEIMGGNDFYETHFVTDATKEKYNIISYPIKHLDNVNAIVYIFHDVTEKELLQKRLLQSEKLASIGELAAGVAHEINNPLGFIMSNVNVLKDYCSSLIKFSTEIDTLTTDKSEKYEELRENHELDLIKDDLPVLLDETTDGVERVSKIVKDLKLFARADEDQPQPMLTQEMVKNALNLARNELKYKMTVSTEFNDKTELKCHPNRIVQVFTNIFVNAAHATEKEGQLNIKTTEDNEAVIVEISDTGCGIPEDVIPKIFDPFFTTKEPGKGTGMGLSISYSIIKKHNGTMKVDSVIGEGTTFTIRLPFEGILENTNDK